MIATERGDALDDFRRARRRARMQGIMARLTGASLELLAFEEVRQQLRARQTVDRGLQQVPLDAIVGSVGRYRDFTRSFLPRHDSDAQRWAEVLMAQQAVGLPPITVYQIGDAYFVQDGNHRVSIARHFGNDAIEAYVTEVQSDVPLSPGDSPDDLILKAEYAGFLEQTRLSTSRPETDLSLTSPGKYPLLLEHIEVHRYYMGLEQGREIDYAEAVAHWHDTVYRPVVQEIQAQGVMREFPERTEADLYVWLADHRAEIEKESGWRVSTAAAVADLASQSGTYQPYTPVQRALQAAAGRPPGQPADQWWRQRHQAISEAHLLGTILVPISPADQDWRALDHALHWARRDAGQVVGLLAVPSESEKSGILSHALQAEFLRRAGGVAAYFKVEAGDLEPLMRKLARWVDLIVLPLPGSQESAAWQKIRDAPGPLLLVPPATFRQGAISLLFEPGSRAVETLFFAAYLSQLWPAPLIVLVTPEQRADLETLTRQIPLDPDVVTEMELGVEAVLAAAAANQSALLIFAAEPAAPRAKKGVQTGWEPLLLASPLPVLLYR